MSIKMKVTSETRAKCKELCDAYKEQFGGSPLNGDYYRNEFISILGELAVSSYLTGSIDAAVSQRERGLAQNRICSGSDIDGFEIDVKSCGMKKPDAIFVNPKHVNADINYVLAHIPCSLNADVEELMSIERLTLIGWCSGSKLWKNDMSNFHHGWHYRNADCLNEMEKLKNDLSN